MTDQQPEQEPLHTPQKDNNREDISTSAEKADTSDIVTIFDVATEIETMLKAISKSVDENDQLVLSKVEKINKKLDKMESAIRSEK